MKQEDEYKWLLKCKVARSYIILNPGKTVEELELAGIEPKVISWLINKEYIRFTENLKVEANPL